MDNLELYQKIHDQILDYADDEIIFTCALWGYSVHKNMVKHNKGLGTAGAEESEDFIYAVVTAVIIGEFAKFAYNDYFSDEVEIDLGPLGLDFEEKGMRYYIGGDALPNRLKLLSEKNFIGLQDMWTTICEYKKEIYKSLKSIHEEVGETDIDYTLFNSINKIFEQIDDEGVAYSSMSDSQKLSAYGYISNGFQY